MAREPRIIYWQKLIKEQAQKKISVTNFCKERRINQQSFYRWRNRLNHEYKINHPDSFLELVPTHSDEFTLSKNRESGIHLYVDQRISIEVDRSFDPVTLHQVLSVLIGNEPCLA